MSCIRFSRLVYWVNWQIYISQCFFRALVIIEFSSKSHWPFSSRGYEILFLDYQWNQLKDMQKLTKHHPFPFRRPFHARTFLSNYAHLPAFAIQLHSSFVASGWCGLASLLELKTTSDEIPIFWVHNVSQKSTHIMEEQSAIGLCWARTRITRVGMLMTLTDTTLLMSSALGMYSTIGQLWTLVTTSVPLLIAPIHLSMPLPSSLSARRSCPSATRKRSQR